MPPSFLQKSPSLPSPPPLHVSLPWPPGRAWREFARLGAAYPGGLRQGDGLPSQSLPRARDPPLGQGSRLCPHKGARSVPPWRQEGGCRELPSSCSETAVGSQGFVRRGWGLGSPVEARGVGGCCREIGLIPASSGRALRGAGRGGAEGAGSAALCSRWWRSSSSRWLRPAARRREAQAPRPAGLFRAPPPAVRAPMGGEASPGDEGAAALPARAQPESGASSSGAGWKGRPRPAARPALGALGLSRGARRLRATGGLSAPHGCLPRLRTTALRGGRRLGQKLHGPPSPSSFAPSRPSGRSPARTSRPILRGPLLALPSRLGAGGKGGLQVPPGETLCQPACLPPGGGALCLPLPGDLSGSLPLKRAALSPAWRRRLKAEGRREKAASGRPPCCPPPGVCLPAESGWASAAKPAAAQGRPTLLSAGVFKSKEEECWPAPLEACGLPGGRG